MEVKQIGNMDEDREPFSNPQCGRVYDDNGLSPTLSTMQGGQRELKIIVAMRGRNPENPSDRTAGSPTEQRLEPNSQGICNTLTSVQKYNMVLETNILQLPRGYNNGGKHKICPSITSHSFQENNFLCDRYRIRKLTPLECWRLMGFSDEDFYKAAEVNSNSQLYKQAGNSLVRVVMAAIMSQLNIKGIKQWNKMSKEERNDIIGEKNKT